MKEFLLFPSIGGKTSDYSVLPIEGNKGNLEIWNHHQMSKHKVGMARACKVRSNLVYLC